MDPITALAAFAPLVVEGGKALISRFLAPAEMKPATVEQYVAMRRVDVDLFQAINGAGGAGESYRWVEAVVRLQRPIVAAAVMATWAYSYIGGTPSPALDNAAGAVGFYLFGDRTLFYARRALAGAPK